MQSSGITKAPVWSTGAKYGRNGWIRTTDLCDPNAARCQAALHPEFLSFRSFLIVYRSLLTDKAKNCISDFVNWHNITKFYYITKSKNKQEKAQMLPPVLKFNNLVLTVSDKCLNCCSINYINNSVLVKVGSLNSVIR